MIKSLKNLNCINSLKTNSQDIFEFTMRYIGDEIQKIPKPLRIFRQLYQDTLIQIIDGAKQIIENIQQKHIKPF